MTNLHKYTPLITAIFLLTFLSACATKRDFYAGKQIDFYNDAIIEECVFEEATNIQTKPRRYKCTRNCSIWIGALYKGPEKWREISFTVYARAFTPVGRNMHGSIYHNLESDQIICGANRFDKEYPEIDRLKFQKFVPETINKVEENYIEYFVGSEDWQK